MPSFWSAVSKQLPNRLLLDDDGLVDIHLQAVVDGLLAGADGDGGVLGDGLGHLLGSGHQLLQGIHGVHQADAAAPRRP